MIGKESRTLIYYLINVACHRLPEHSLTTPRRLIACNNFRCMSRNIAFLFPSGSVKHLYVLLSAFPVAFSKVYSCEAKSQTQVVLPFHGRHWIQ